MVLLAIGATAIQAVLGYFSFRNSIQRDITDDIHKYVGLIADAIDLSNPTSPQLIFSKLPLSKEFQGRFRLMEGNNLTPIIEGGGRFPEADPNWVRYRMALTDNYAVEVALDQYTHEKALGGYLSTLWISLTLSFLIALALALALRNVLLRPLQALESATQTLARERNPTAIPVLEGGEIGRLTQSFNKMSEQVHKAFERERSFTRYASHELRTPLSALKSHVEAANLGVMAPEEALGVAARNLDHMERVLGGLLKLAKGVGKPSTLELSDFALEIIESLPSTDQSRVRLQIEGGRLSIPHEALEGAVRNLLENALRYSEGTVELVVEAQIPRITVRDYGQGVPPDVVERLGQPFFRWHTGLEGTGLGLAFTRQIAETLGGSLELRNHPSGGFEAQLWLTGATRV